MSIITYTMCWEKEDINRLLHIMPHNSEVIGLELSFHPPEFDVDITTSLLGWKTTMYRSGYSRITHNLTNDIIESICNCMLSDDQKSIDVERIDISYSTGMAIIDVKRRLIDIIGEPIINYDDCKRACPNILGFTLKE